MHRSRICLSAAAVALLATCVAGAEPPKEMKLVNPQLAGQTGQQVPDGWSPWPGGDGGKRVMSLVTVDGEGAVRIVDNDPGAGLGFTQVLPAEAGHRYAFTGQARGGLVFVEICFRNDKKAELSETRKPIPAGEQWRTRTVRAVAPPGASSLRVWFYSPSDNIADVTVRRPVLVDEGPGPFEDKGPVTDDQEFFRQLNLDFPGLEKVKAAVAAGDVERAKAEYLQFRRTASKARFRLYWRPDREVDAEPTLPATMPATAAVKSHPAADLIFEHKIAMPWGADRNAYFVGDPINWNFVPYPKNDPRYSIEWNTIAINRFYYWNVLADGYWQTLDEKYARQFVAQLESFVRENPVLLDAAPGDTMTWSAIVAACRMNESWINAYFRFLPSQALTPAAHARFAVSCYEHALRLRQVLQDYPAHGGNWVTMECRALATVAMVFPEFKQSPQFLELACERAAAELSKQVYPDGGQTELSTSYHYTALENFVGLARLAALNGVKLPEAYLQRVRLMYLWGMRLCDQSLALPKINDSDWTRIGSTLKEAHALFGGQDFAWAANEGKTGPLPPRSSFLPYSGYGAMRAGWAPGDFYLFFDFGPVGTGHWHEDMLNFVLQWGGRTLVTEAGNYNYDQSAWRSYVLGTTAHNTITIDGKQQHRAGPVPPDFKPCPVSWTSHALYDHARGTYDKGYQAARYIQRPYFPLEYFGPLDTSVTHTRDIVFVPPRLAVVVDFLEGTGQHEVRQYFHLEAPGAELDTETLAVRTAGKDARLSLVPLVRDGLTAGIHKGEEKPEVLGWVMEESRPRAIPTVVYQRRATMPATLATLLTPLRGDEPAARAAPIAVAGGDGYAATFVWGGRTLSLALRRPGAAVMECDLADWPGVRTDAAMVYAEQGRDGSFLSLDDVKQFRQAALSLTAAVPAKLLAVVTKDKVLITNAGDDAVKLELATPWPLKLDLPPRRWYELSAQGASEAKTPPSLEGK